MAVKRVHVDTDSHPSPFIDAVAGILSILVVGATAVALFLVLTVKGVPQNPPQPTTQSPAATGSTNP
jgi:hypothetical protein